MRALKKQYIFSITLCVFIVSMLVSCAKGKFVRLESAGSLCSMLRATKDISIGEVITEEAAKNSIVKLKRGQSIPEAIRDRQVLLKLKPIKKIPEGSLFYFGYFDIEELKSSQQDFYERNIREFKKQNKSNVRE